MSVENIIVPELMVSLIWGGSKCDVRQRREYLLAAGFWVRVDRVREIGHVDFLWSCVGRCFCARRAHFKPHADRWEMRRMFSAAEFLWRQWRATSGVHERAWMRRLLLWENVLPVSLAPWRIVSTADHNVARPGRSVVGMPLWTLAGRPRTPPGQPRTLQGQPPTPPPRPHPPRVAASDPAKPGCAPSLGAL